MGACLDSCIKQQIAKDKHILKDHESSALILESLKRRDEQLISSETLFSIQSNSISRIFLDVLIIFADSPENMIKNPFISALGVSQTTNLLSKINDAIKTFEKNKQFIVIHNPFHNIPIKKLLFCQMKVWDGRQLQKRYVKKIVQNAFWKVASAGKKVELGIMEIQPNLGYNLKDFYQIVMLKLRQYSNKFHGVTYVTHKKREIEKFLQEDLPQILQSESTNNSEKSNYF